MMLLLEKWKPLNETITVNAFNLVMGFFVYLSEKMSLFLHLLTLKE
jgi:hypothetical protein